MNFVDIYQKYWKNGYTLTDLSLSGIDREVFRSLFNPVAEVFRKYPAGDVHLYIPGVGQVQGLQPENYFDSAGTTLASVDGSVGAVLDAAGSVGADVVVGGDFSSAAQWSSIAGFTIASGALSINAGGGAITNNAGASAVIGKTYKIDFDVPAFTSGQVKAFMGGAGGVAANAVGHYSSYVVATTTDKPQIYVTSGGTVCQVDNIVVREVTGIHATQSTPGYKPTLRKGIVNRANDSHNVGGWPLSNGATRSGNVISFPNEYALVAVGQSQAITSGPATIAFKLSGAGTCRILQDTSGAGGAAAVASVILTAEPTIYVGTFTATNTFSAILSRWGGDTATSVTAECVGIFAGTLTAQQILAAGGIPLTTTAPASSQAGVNYAEFDGVDDYLATGGSTDTSGILCLGCKPSSLAYMTPLGSGAISGNNAGVAIKFRNNGDIWFRSSNGALANDSIASAAYSVGTPLVVTGTWTPVTQKIRINSSEKNSSSCFSALSATNLAIGRHDSAAGAEYFKGGINVAVYIKGTVSDADLLVLEKFVAQLSGVTL